MSGEFFDGWDWETEPPTERRHVEDRRKGERRRPIAADATHPCGHGSAEDSRERRLFTPHSEDTPAVRAAKLSWNEGERRAQAAPGAWLASLTSAERKEVAVARGLFAYFPDALALIARHSARSNEKHNPGQLIHWSREKSADHEDSIARHSLAVAVDEGSMDGDVPDIVRRAWRALAALQVWVEKKHAKGEKL